MNFYDMLLTQKLSGGSGGELLYLINNSGSVEDAVVPVGVIRIPKYFFYNNTALKSVSLPEGLVGFGQNAFQDTNNLKTITIPSTVTSMGANTFRSKSMDSITMLPTTPPTLGNAFASASIAHIYVPAGSVDAYKTAWSSFASVIEAIPE